MIQISTQISTREKNIATNENCIMRKMSLKFQNLIFNFLYIYIYIYSFPEQAKVAEWGADSMERAAQVKIQAVWWDSLEKW